MHELDDTKAEFWTKGGLGVWCRDRHGRSWIVKRSDAVHLAVTMLAHNETYQELRLVEFKKRLQVAIDLRQIVFFFDSKNSVLPVVIVTWARMSKPGLSAYLKSGKLAREDWISGNEIGLIDIFHSGLKSNFRWIIRDLESVIFPDIAVAYSRKAELRENSKNTFQTWKNTFYRRYKSQTSETKFQLGRSQTPLPPGPYLLHPFRDLKFDRVLVAKAETSFIDTLSLNSGARVLILGTDATDFATHLASEYGCAVTLFDDNARFLVAAAESGASLKIDRHLFGIKHGDFSELPFDDNLFDQVISFGALSRLDQPLVAIKEALRVLRKQGTIALFEIMTKSASGDLNTVRPFGIKSVVSFSEWNSQLQPHVNNYSTVEVDQQHNLAALTSWYHGMLQLKHRPMLPALSQPSDTPKAETAVIRSQLFIGRKVKHINLSKPAVSASRRKTTLVTFSGGIDSTYLLWKLLTTTNDQLLVHHINIWNDEDRTRAEQIVARRIVRYLSREYRQVSYGETGVEHHNLPWFGYDMTAVGFEVGLVANGFRMDMNRAVDRWAMGSCLEEDGWSQRWDHVKACVAASCFPHEAPPYFSLPIIEKAEQIAQMPAELVDMTWYCRNPLITRSGFVNCKVCNTCNLVVEATAKLHNMTA